MSLRACLAGALSVLFGAGLALRADNLFLLPDGTSSSTVKVYSAAPLSLLGTYPGSGGGPSWGVLANPAGSRFFTLADAQQDAVVVVNDNLVVTQRSGVWNRGAAAAVVTPDGQRVLVAADTLRVLDASSGLQLASIALTSPPTDVAVSFDSRYAYLLSPTAQKLFKVDLQTATVIDQVTIPGQSTGVALAPNCYLYVTTNNRVYVIEPSSFQVLTQIGLNGLPRKLSFTPDGKYGVATNALPTTLASGWIFDLASNTVQAVIPTVSSGSALVTMDPRVLVVSNDRAIFSSQQTRTLYQVTIPDGAIGPLPVPGGVSDLQAVVASPEMPSARFLYYATSSTLVQVVLSTNAIQATVGLVDAPYALAYAGPASVGPATGAILYNDQQSVAAGEAFRPILVRALDANGRPVFNAPVVWQASHGAVTIQDASSATNLEGIAQAKVVVEESIGPFTVTARIGTGLTVEFHLTAGAAPTGRPGIVIVSGQGQLIGDTLAQLEPERTRLVVQVFDRQGNPLRGANVNWTVIEGQGTLVSNTTTTDEEGKTSNNFVPALVPLGYSYAQARIRASHGDDFVDFYFTAYPTQGPGGATAPEPQVQVLAPPPGTEIVGRAGETLSGAIRVLVVGGTGMGAGLPIPNVAVTVTTGLTPPDPVASCAGTWALTSADTGIATCDLQLGGLGSAAIRIDVGNSFRVYPDRRVRVLPGLPAQIVLLQGNNQSGRPGETLPWALVAEVRDAFGNPLPGTTVQWEVDPPNSVTLSQVMTVANTEGRVSALARLGNTPGTATVRVRAGAAVGNFTVTILVNVTSLTKVSGDNQVALTGQQFPMPLVVALADDRGSPVPNQTVSFQVVSGSATLSSSTAMTDASGQARVNVTAGSSAGTVVVRASYQSLTPVEFTLHVRLPGPSILASSFVNGASGRPGVVPGSVVKIVGPGLAPNIQNCVLPGSLVGPLPLELAGVTVQFGPDDSPIWAPIFYVCNVNGEQSVAIQAPFELQPGTVRVTVRVAGGATTVENVPVLRLQPGLFETMAPSGLRYGVLVRPDGSFVSPANPARRGEVIRMFATGLGVVNPPAHTNHLGQEGQEVQATVVVGVNNAGVRVLRARYAPGMIGVYIVDFEVPPDTEPGPERPLVLAVVGDDGNLIFSNGSVIPIQ